MTEKIKIFSSATDLFDAAAEDFLMKTSRIIKEKGVCNVVLSGGNTPKKFYSTLVDNDRFKKNIFWEKIRFFFGDERYVAPDDVQSNYHTAQEFLFSKVPVAQKNIFRVPTEFASAAESAEQYEQTLRQLFGVKDFQWPAFDITYLGMGDDGHTASLMPFTALVKHYVEHANDELPALVASLWVERLNMYRITLTPPAINHSNAIVFLVEGEGKAFALKEVVESRHNALQYPAILIKKAVWLVDKAAASQLERNR